MDFIAYTESWARAEAHQARIMITVGIFLAIAFVAILFGGNLVLRGSLVPLGLILAILMGYGSYMLRSRPSHAREMIRLYQRSPGEAIEKERAKHTDDNKAGNFLLRVYPVLMIFSALAAYLSSSPESEGMALGFVLLFISTFMIDIGFVSRSNGFLAFLGTVKVGHPNK